MLSATIAALARMAWLEKSAAKNSIPATTPPNTNKAMAASRRRSWMAIPEPA